jgi:hypothetical protein
MKKLARRYGMKKFIFSLFALLLVMALASCGGMNPLSDKLIWVRFLF